MQDELFGRLANGGAFRATDYSVDLQDVPDGPIRSTDLNDVKSVSRQQNRVTLTMAKGRPVVIDTASLDDAGRLTSRIQSSLPLTRPQQQRGSTLGSIAKYGCLMPLVGIGALVVLGIILIALAAGGSGGGGIGGKDVHVSLADGASGTVTSAGKTAKVTVVKVTDNARSANQFSQPPAGMRYWVAQVIVENADDEEIYSGDWKLRTSDNSEFDRTFVAGLDALGPSLEIVQNLTPGGKTQGILVFEIPVGVTITFLRYDGNVFANGDLYFDGN